MLFRWPSTCWPDMLFVDRKSTRLNSSHANISYAVFCLKKNHRGERHRPARLCHLPRHAISSDYSTRIPNCLRSRLAPQGNSTAFVRDAPNFFFLIIRPPPRSTLFPHTTLSQ